MQRIDASTLDLKEKVVNIGRVTKVVKGGRNFRFSALVVIGDENGHVGSVWEKQPKYLTQYVRDRRRKEESNARSACWNNNPS